MALVRDSKRIGFWSDPQQLGKAGTYAVVIGISSYPHLAGGSGAPAPQSYDLGQLAVSALTAHAVFEWLQAHYRYTDAPLAACWLLLSPNKDELETWPRLRAAAADPATFDNCEVALTDWAATMGALHPDDAERSRAVFFFSGHGMEITQEHQVLLPSDYLAGVGNPNRALSTLNLVRGLQALPLLEAFFFVDACRNRPDALARTRVRGHDILVESETPPRPEQVTPVVYASAAGTEAWQPASPEDGPSFFGRALLEGLSVQAPLLAECDQTICRLHLFRLARHLMVRVPELLHIQGDPRLVRLGGPGGLVDPCVTEVPLPTAGPPPPPPAVLGTFRRPAAPRAPADATVAGAAPGAAGAAAPAAPPAAGAGAIPGFEATVVANLPAAGVTPPGMSWSDLHAVFGHETLTNLWSAARIMRIAAPPAGGILEDREHTLHNVAYNGTRRLTVELSFPRRGLHWLELPTGTDRFAVMLPDDAITPAPPRYILDIHLEWRPGQVVLGRMDARLSQQNSPPLGTAARIWDAYDRLDIPAAVAAADRASQEDVLFAKGDSPLAAMIAGLFLLRVHDYAKLHDWLRNLSDRFPQLADGPVLWAEQLLRDREVARWEANPRAEVVRQLLQVAQRGLPTTGQTLGLLARQLEELLRIPESGPDRPTETWPQDHAALTALLAHVSTALAVFRTGGLFTSFSGPADIVRPELLLPLVGAMGAGLDPAAVPVPG